MWVAMFIFLLKQLIRKHNEMTTVADDDIIIAGFVSGYNFENKQI